MCDFCEISQERGGRRRLVLKEKERERGRERERALEGKLSVDTGAEGKRPEAD